MYSESLVEANIDYPVRVATKLKSLRVASESQ
ncbi:hypothetical protein ES703_40588 [subsurface metagenome]